MSEVANCEVAIFTFYNLCKISMFLEKGGNSQRTGNDDKYS